MADCFTDLFMTLSKEINPEAFIELQRQLLGNIKDKSSYEAEKILSRIIYFYNDLQESEKAWEYVENNIQISRFRKQVVEKRIEEKKLAEAKKLIRDYIKAKTMHHLDEWDDFLLQIALAENDISATRSISHSFIKDSFREQYYQIYKAAFTSDEWPEKFEELLAHYKTERGLGNHSAAELLAAESMAERLLNHIEKNLSLKNMEQYHAFFAAAFPEKTLVLFRKAVDDYARNNTGRSCYAHIVEVFDKMKKIPGGDTITADMKAAYLLKYKNRRAMREILEGS
jgi:hypothetical protein